MKLRRLGGEGPEISVIGFGAWEAGGGAEWGAAPPDDRVIDAIRAGLDAGISWIDTAEVYGAGHSEELVGRAVAGRRDATMIFTKVGPDEGGSGFRPEQIRAACEASLKRLGTDWIDLYQLHWPDPLIPVEDSWGAMTELVADGLVRWIGVSNFDADLLRRCLDVRRVDSLQPEFSLLAIEHRELIRSCGELGVGVLSYAPLAYGLLTGAITRDTRFDESDFRGGADEDETWAGLFAPGKIERSLSVVEGLRRIGERLGVTIAQLALAWNVHQPGVTGAIAGSRDPDHVRENAAAGVIDLEEDDLRELEDLLRLGPAFD
jgi:aryl-alcohol dehydrogenase-like predicted oxidoreductase